MSFLVAGIDASASNACAAQASVPVKRLTASTIFPDCRDALAQGFVNDFAASDS
jgi:hypothetical protein